MATPRRQRYLLTGALVALCSLGTAQAVTCNGTANPCDAASASYADIAAAVLLTPRSGTLRVPASASYVNWGSGTLTLTKGINLVGPGRDALAVDSGGSAIEHPHIQVSPDGNAGDVFRIEGFTFLGGSYTIVASMGANAKLVVGWNRFTQSANTCVYLGTSSTALIYQNDFDMIHRLLWSGGTDTMEDWVGVTPSFSDTRNVFLETNTMHNTSSYDAGGNLWTESGQGGRICLRFNSYDFANGSTDKEILDVHGFQNFDVTRTVLNYPPCISDADCKYGQTGSQVALAYGNTIVNADGFRTIHHRGSIGLFFNNILTGSGGANVIHAGQYGTGDSGGSGCNVAVAAVCDGTGTTPACHGILYTGTGQIHDTFTFNNLLNGSPLNMTKNTVNTFQCSISEDNGWTNYHSDFDGTAVGIGRGTGNPPATCLVGSGYWKAADPTPTTDSAAIAAGTFYQCTSVNTWTAVTLHTYPHELAGAGPGIGPTPTPSPSQARGFFSI